MFRHAAQSPRVIALSLVVAAAVAAPQVVLAATPSAVHDSKPARFTDDELARGLLLASGPVADVVPEVREYLRPASFVKDARQLAAINRMHDRIMAALEAEHPEFVASFAADVRSGDRVRLAAAYQKAGEVMRQTLLSMPEVVTMRQRLTSDPAFREQLRKELVRKLPADASANALAEQASLRLAAAALQKSTAQADGTCVAAVVYLVVVVVGVATLAVEVNYAAAAQIAALDEVAWSPTAVAAGGAPSLLREQIIDSAARLLRAA